MADKQRSRAESLLPEILPDLITLLNEAPDFGICTLGITFLGGRVSRIMTTKEVSRKPGEKPRGR